MGPVLIEVLTNIIKTRFGVDVTFGEGSIVYKETIKNKAYGIGHFEPLRHYAEVHLLLEPGEPGSGMRYECHCSEDILDKNWQRLVYTHLCEKMHRGVLTGSELTDMKITLVAGRAHPKHTEGGDFRQATYRAVRQGLMQAESVLLEPFYAFSLEVKRDYVGRAMTDFERMGAAFNMQEADGDNVVITGEGPVSVIGNYQAEVNAYTKGTGRLALKMAGYRPCHNTEEVIERFGYEPERDTRNPVDSVFCAGGSGYVVPWNEVREHAHVEIAVTDSGVAGGQSDREVKLTAKQAYQNFNAQLLTEKTTTDETVLTSGKSYSNVFHKNGGSASFSVMANTLRGVYGTDVLIAAANSFTGSVLQADYNQKMAASMIMPNGLMSRQRTMTGAELKETVRAFVEGCEGGFVPFNRGSLPVASGITMEVKEAGGSYTLTGITRNGQPLKDDDTVTVTCLATEKQMEALLASKSGTTEDGDAWVKNTWRDHVSGGGAALAEPENYMTLR